LITKDHSNKKLGLKHAVAGEITITGQY